MKAEVVKFLFFYILKFQKIVCYWVTHLIPVCQGLNCALKLVYI